MASANCCIISARMSCSENTAEKRSFGLSWAKAGNAAMAAATPIPIRTCLRFEKKFMSVLPLKSSLQSALIPVTIPSCCRLEMGGHLVHVGGLASKQLERPHGLANRHADPRHRLAPNGLCSENEFCLEREIDDIGHPVRGCQKCYIEWRAGIFRHAHRRRVYHAVGSVDLVNVAAGTYRAIIGSIKATRKFFGPLGILVDDDEFLHAILAQRVSDRCAGAPGPELHNAPTGNIGKVLAHALGKTPDIGVVSHRSVWPEYNRI